jgi:hypothetical protein
MNKSSNKSSNTKIGGLLDPSLMFSNIIKTVPKTLPVSSSKGEIFSNYNNLANQVNNGNLKVGYYKLFGGTKDTKDTKDTKATKATKETKKHKKNDAKKVKPTSIKL